MPLHLPERASLEYSRKLAKERLAVLRATNPATRLADAQFAIAHEYGFSSWRALKAEIDRRRAPNAPDFWQPGTTGGVEASRTPFRKDPNHPRQRDGAASTRFISPGLHS